MSPMRSGGFLGRAFIGARMLGVDVERAVSTVRSLPRFARDAIAYWRAREEADGFPLALRNIVPMLTDFADQAGTASGDYFHQDLWAAKRVFAHRPVRHVDVGSRVDGLVSHLLCFMDVEVVDIRPLDSEVAGLRFVQDDALSLAKFADESVPSLSCLHALEHFGLGRYGDPIAPNGWRRGIDTLQRVLAPGGRLYFSVPIGREHLAFNAQRVFAPSTILRSFTRLSLRSASVVDESGRLCEDADPLDFEDVRRACGLFEWERALNSPADDAAK